VNISCHWLRKKYVNNDDDNSNNNNKNNPIYLLLNAFRNCFLNIKLKSATTQDVDYIIKSLKPKDTYGCDAVSTNSLKISCFYISSLLNHACNTSLSSEIFPQRLKYSVVKPLYKKSERNYIYNYGPVSLLI
jgi:phosphatidylinositol kinase/protein kinase (PI-3  family)